MGGLCQELGVSNKVPRRALNDVPPQLVIFCEVYSLTHQPSVAAPTDWVDSYQTLCMCARYLGKRVLRKPSSLVISGNNR